MKSSLDVQTRDLKDRISNEVSQKGAQFTQQMEAIEQENDRFKRELKIVNLEDQRMEEGLFGEIFMTSKETNGGLEMLQFFKGKLISSLGGGEMKLFVIENYKDDIQGVISSLHAPEYDDYDYTFTDREEIVGKISNPQQLIQSFNHKGKLTKIISGKHHILFLTNQGTVFSWGYGQYGSLGLGGVVQSQIPRQLTNISQQQIIQIACGEFHSLVLTKLHDVYIWGKGFQGQLGMGKEIQTISIPKYLSAFNKPHPDEQSIKKLSKIDRINYKNYITYIACGANHSLCINYQGRLYSWGENTTGQIGIGNTKNQFTPQEIKHFYQDTQIICQDKIVKVDAGFGHTVAINNQGQVFTWGFNSYGQLGLGDYKTRVSPQIVSNDQLSNQLPFINKISCGYFNTFAIDSQGRLYSWGGGNLGQKDEKSQKAPRKIEAHTEGRIFTDVFSNRTSSLFFAKARIISIRPESGPSSGNTMISLVGTGFSNTGNQKVRFSLSGKKVNQYRKMGPKSPLKKTITLTEENSKTIQVEVSCDFDPVTDCYHCFTPNFDESSEEIMEWPIECKVELTLDGQTYIQYDNTFLIYSSKLFAQNIYPKCASIQGGTILTLVIPNMDAKTAGVLNNLTIGFQPKMYKSKPDYNNKQSSHIQQQNNNDSQNTQNQSSINIQNNDTTRPQSRNNIKLGAINPLNIQPDDIELEKENWVCVVGHYQNEKITCVVPKIENLNKDQMQFNIDIALNGQQFTGQPSSFRFFSIKVNKMEPSCGAFDGGLNIKIIGEGFFDTINKQIMFKSILGERIIALNWDKNLKEYNFIQPPLNWLLAGNEQTPDIIQQVLSHDIILNFSLNGVEWLNIGKFQYVEPDVERIGHVDEKILNNLFEAEEHFILKSHDDLIKIQEIDQYECQTLFKKTHSKLYIYGTHFQNLPTLKAQFTYNHHHVETSVFFKNEKQLAVIIPDMPDCPQGIHEIQLEVSLNGIQFSKQQKTFRMMCFDQAMNQDQRNKLEENELKILKAKKK